MARRAVDDGRPDDVIWKGGKLYFKKRYPVEVRKARPDLPAVFEISLRTGDIATAKSRHAAARVEYDAACREALTPRKPETAEEWLRSLTPEQRDQVVAIADTRTAKRFGPAPDAEEALARLSWEFTQSAMVAANAAATPEPLSNRASAVLSPEAQKRVQAAITAELHRATEAEGLALMALGYPEAELPQSVRQAVTALTEASKAKTLSDALAIRTQDIGDDRYKGQIEWAVRLFHGVVGEKPLVELRNADLADFEAAIRRMPTSSTVRNSILNGKISVREALEGAKEADAKLTPQTINKHVSFIRALSKLAFGKGLLGDKADPFVSFIATRAKKVKQRKHFNATELEALFAEMGKTWMADHRERVWICLLALFHGARREEICQLLKSDVREVGGIWCANITTLADDEDPDDDEVKRLKTDNATRVIPIHHRLIDAGFIDFVKSAKGPRLFGSLTQDADGRFGGKFGMQFGELRTRAGITVKRIRTFHGFRHTAIGEMHERVWPRRVVLAISGHAEGGADTNDGYGGDVSPKATKPYVDKLTYDVAALDAVLKALASPAPVSA